jgi:hypothetical protein
LRVCEKNDFFGNGRSALKDDGREGEGLWCEERNVRAKDDLFVLDCFGTSFLAMTLAEGRAFF